MNNSNWIKSVLVGLALGSLLMLLQSTSQPSKLDSRLSPEGLNRGSSLSTASAIASTAGQTTSSPTPTSQSVILRTHVESLPDTYVKLCQALPSPESFGYPVVSAAMQDGCVDCQVAEATAQPSKYMRGIDATTDHRLREPRWRSGGEVAWEQFAYGEYIGPHRTPHVDEYRIRIGDQVEFNFLQTRQRLPQKYQLKIGDLIQISSAVDPSLTQPPMTGSGINGLQIMPDGSVSLALIGEIQASGKTIEDLQQELNNKYFKYVKNPSMIVQVTKSDTPVADLLEAVDSRFGQGGRSRQVTVSPDGTIQLPMVGSVPAIGLTLAEMGREVNARYRERIHGVEVTPILLQRAPRFVYVLGEVRTAGRYELTAPTTAMQAITLAGGFDRRASNLRQVIVFRRDQNWQLVATKLDLSGALYGKSPRPSDEIWLRDSDIVLIPPKPIQRLSDAVNLYLTNTVYAIFPQQGVAFSFDDFRSL